MWSHEVEARWQREIDEVMTGMKEWRLQHPRATLKEIEAALDARLARVRARMLQDIALSSKATRIGKQVIERESETGGEESERPKCPKCGGVLQPRGEERRTLLTNYNQEIELTRSYGYCPACEAGLFPPR